MPKKHVGTKLRLVHHNGLFGIVCGDNGGAAAKVGHTMPRNERLVGNVFLVVAKATERRFLQAGKAVEVTNGDLRLVEFSRPFDATDSMS